MTDHVVLFPADDEAAWEAGTEADHQATYDVDAAFVRALQARGGAVTGGAGLAHSSTTQTLRRGGTLTQGPCAKSVEQLSGFYLVTCEDRDALLEAAEVLTGAHPVVKVRPVDGS